MVRTAVMLLLNIILINIPTSLSDPNLGRTSGGKTLDLRIGHGIVPNLSPDVGPAMRSENLIKMKDLFNFDLLTGLLEVSCD